MTRRDAKRSVTIPAISPTGIEANSLRDSMIISCALILDD